MNFKQTKRLAMSAISIIQPLCQYVVFSVQRNNCPLPYSINLYKTFVNTHRGNVPQEGLEPSTNYLAGSRSIRLNYCGIPPLYMIDWDSGRIGICEQSFGQRSNYSTLLASDGGFLKSSLQTPLWKVQEIVLHAGSLRW